MVIAPKNLTRTAALYDKMQRVAPPFEWPVFAQDADVVVAEEEIGIAVRSTSQRWNDSQEV
jgi:hypothetical protein